MSAYLLIKATITDPQRFSDYTAVVPGLVKQFGGQYIVMDSQPDFLEGVPDCKSTVISKWPDKKSAEAFWQSDAYQAMIPLREGTGQFQVMLLQGIEE